MVRSFYCGYEEIAAATVGGIGWDEKVTQVIQTQQLAWREQIPLRPPRYYFADSDSVDIELHGFSDAESAYAAVVYIRFSHLWYGEPTVTLVSKV